MALRYGLRRSPVYVGHSAHYQAVVEYIAPHWEQTNALLSGLHHFLERSIQQNGNALSNQLCKRYPILAENAGMEERLVDAVKQAFSD